MSGTNIDDCLCRVGNLFWRFGDFSLEISVLLVADYVVRQFYIRCMCLVGKLRNYSVDHTDVRPTRSMQSVQWRGLECGTGTSMRGIVFRRNIEGVGT